MKSSSQIAVNHRKETDVDKDISDGILDGITLFRFAHMSRNENSGGVEAYLSNLNYQLLQRNRMRILQMYLAAECGPFEITVNQIGRGEVVWIPSLFKSNREVNSTRLPWIWSILRKLYNSSYKINHDILLSALANYQINLAVFHWISKDSRVVIKYLNKKSVPFVVVNHFQNTRLHYHYIRQQISRARAVGGVSNIDVPSFVRNRFKNLSDGVDTDFFHPGKAIPLERKISYPLILLPSSRIEEEKGHCDAIKALGFLARDGIIVTLVLTGRVEVTEFMNKLQTVISEEGMQSHVTFTGELTHAELRNWYAASSLVVLPSYTEGLPKVLLEAQAMERPPVAYNVGGIPEAIQNTETGYLIKKGDIEGFAGRLKELIEKPEIRREMGKRGRQFVVQQFSMESLTIRHELFYSMNLNKSTFRLENMVST